MKKKNIFIPVLLILIGTLFLFLNINIFKGYWALLFIGITLFMTYLFIGGPNVEVGFSILLPSCHLITLWIYYLLKSIQLIEHEGFLLIFLSFAFFIFFFVHTRHGQPKEWWSLITGSVLLLLGICWIVAFAIWPIFFILLGLIMLIKR